MNKMDTEVQKQHEHKREHVHFIGIGGYGMSAIARVMLDMGCHVTGSDVARKELTDKLQKKGAQVFIGHQAENIAGADLVVYSTDIPKENVELTAAKAQAIPLIHRSKMLARLLNEKKGVAVAGAHGKTTTSSMIALVMEKAGIDPTYLIGGEIMDIGSNAKAGQGDFVVAEADESDGTFLEYFPHIAVVTNIEPDHLENYDGDFENLKKAYRQFLSQVKENGTAVVCIDDDYVEEMLAEKKANVSLSTYAIDKQADYMASNIEPGDRTISFDVTHKGKLLGRMKLSVPGIHNVYNALATVAVCMQANLTFEEIADAIIAFRGAKRRFQVIGEVNDILVVDDYAHHPTEIEATLEAARSTNRRTVAIFQPQRYTRTFFLLDAFSKAFGKADEVIIVDIYSPANDPEIEGVSAEKLVDLIKQNSNANAKYIASKEEVVEHLKRTVTSGDLVLTMGAGDIWKAAVQLVEEMEKK
ncbi:UDP-N-acetylmuramate--L-alanine ligase [Aneurinibacillus aneurinilyticus]|uniref:UDP-N-acetylmuramate--L-alanine ligase n=1 Tax=Aneurinibacillus aneurinilyticus TaxID=1391 RepID=UPI00366D7C47